MGRVRRVCELFTADTGKKWGMTARSSRKPEVRSPGASQRGVNLGHQEGPSFPCDSSEEEVVAMSFQIR